MIFVLCTYRFGRPWEFSSGSGSGFIFVQVSVLGEASRLPNREKGGTKKVVHLGDDPYRSVCRDVLLT